MPVTTATFVASLDLDYPSDDAPSSTASLSWSVAQDTKRAVKATFPNISSEVSANPAELHTLLGLGGTTIAQSLLDLSATFSTQKLGKGSTATAANHWGSSTKFVQSATPASAIEGDIWFQI